jgi:molecular chaperone IbpA
MRYDFSPLYRSTVGFDRLLDTFGRQLDADAAPGWPPYDIERVSEDAYRISLAVAGFATDEIELIQKENELTVTGHKNAKDETTQYLHRGIANRAFKQTFNLAEHVRVVEASQGNGLLVISLKREVPAALKPRRIEISSSLAQPETQDNTRTQPEQMAAASRKTLRRNQELNGLRAHARGPHRVDDAGSRARDKDGVMETRQSI